MALPTRNEVPEELTWDLSRIFKLDKDWENAYQNVKNDINDLADLKNTITNSGKDLYEAITQMLAVKRRFENIYVYATMARC